MVTFCNEISEDNLKLLKINEISPKKKTDLDLEAVQKKLS